jgi:hypothetical protein
MSLNQNRVTIEKIQKLLNEAETEEHVFWGKVLVVSYKLPNGFTLEGVGSCVDPANFDLEIGRMIARKKVEDQMWLLEGYKLQEELFKAGVL